MRALSVFSLLLVLLGTAFAVPFRPSEDLLLVKPKNCGSADDPWEITEVLVHPEQPKLGDDVEIKVGGIDRGETVEGGKVDIAVTFNGYMQLYSGQLQMCKYVECPIKADSEFQYSYEVGIPKRAPHGKYTVEINMRDENGNRLACIEEDFDM